MVQGTGGPRAQTSRRRITYRDSSWRVREWRAAGGRGAALSAGGALLLWTGSDLTLGDAALCVPGAGCTRLLGAGAGAEAVAALAQRLAARARRPVYVCGPEPDRLARPLLERALLAELVTAGMLDRATPPRDPAPSVCCDPTPPAGCDGAPSV